MTVYRSGVPAGATGPQDAPPQARRVFSGWRALLPRAVMLDLARVAFDRADRANTPPRGEPFYLAGKPYATVEEFIDDLAAEFREEVRRYIEKGGQTQH